jgi:hypothetical protein
VAIAWPEAEGAALFFGRTLRLLVGKCFPAAVLSEHPVRNKFNHNGPGNITAAVIFGWLEPKKKF